MVKTMNESLPPEPIAPPPTKAGFTIAVQGDKILLDYGVPTFGHTLTVGQAEKYVRALKNKIREIKRKKYGKTK